MKFKFLFPAFLLLIVFTECRPKDSSKEAEQQIVSAEIAFNKSVKEKGVKNAFLEFADDSAAISRLGKIYSTKEGIENYFNSQSLKITALTWAPDFVKASAAGDMGYTYGRYQLSGEDTTGKKIDFEGIFHTVWKKQEDGS